MHQAEITVVISNKEIAAAPGSALDYIKGRLKTAGVPEPFWNPHRGIVAATGRLRYERGTNPEVSTYVWQSDGYVKESKDA